MRYIREYKKFQEIDILTDDAIKHLDYEIIMDLLYKFRNKDIGDKLWKIVDRFESEDPKGYSTPKDWFEDKDYKTFMQYFKRKISSDKWKEITENEDNIMSIPCECDVHSIGDFKDVKTFLGPYNSTGQKEIMSLKKPTRHITEDLKDVGIKDIDKLSFINMELLKLFYHRVHSPISGKIKRIIEVKPEDSFFDENNLWIVDIETKENGNVYLMLVGELSIQDFSFRVKKGDTVNMYDEIGNFNWASQVIIIYDKKKFDKNFAKTGKRYFVGDRIF